MSAERARKMFNAKVNELSDISSDRSMFLGNERYNKILRELKEAQELRKSNKPLTTKHYRRLKRYDVIKVGDEEKLIEAGSGEKDGATVRFYCKTHELFDVIERVHAPMGHIKMRAMEIELKKHYCNVTRQVIDIFLSFCDHCRWRKNAPKREPALRPVLTNYLNFRCQVDLIDMQSEPDQDYRFILNYQDDLTKFTILRPLKSQNPGEVAYQLMDIFCIFGAPFILQSDNGREFAKEIIQNLVKICPKMKLVHGKSKYSQNQEVRDMLIEWMSQNKTKCWSEALRFVQSKRNRISHSGINTSPHEAMFGTAQSKGLADSIFTEDLYCSIETEEELEQLFIAEMKKSNESEEENQASLSKMKRTT